MLLHSHSTLVIKAHQTRPNGVSLAVPGTGLPSRSKTAARAQANRQQQPSPDKEAVLTAVSTASSQSTRPAAAGFLRSLASSGMWASVLGSAASIMAVAPGARADVQPVHTLSESGGLLGFLPTGVAVAIAVVLGYNLIRQKDTQAKAVAAARDEAARERAALESQLQATRSQLDRASKAAAESGSKKSRGASRSVSPAPMSRDELVRAKEQELAQRGAELAQLRNELANLNTQMEALQQQMEPTQAKLAAADDRVAAAEKAVGNNGL
ncbi:hypothetical protein DUNSADRAFT_9204 [Dunaliella salina]|uniref:Uncharacterized protein n=1 Tax=Dunaliella salina TaxID=3046 RepID=A0ABQ7GHX0_DUNSA|nr:hypothetical protein DUNSADRAFT_9204 [Dunaliella salina]|eukprot:KAF5834214.1 hypothetical protein DUNSADRAFT_9204 [Dunaliella salina]